MPRAAAAPQKRRVYRKVTTRYAKVVPRGSSMVRQYGTLRGSGAYTYAKPGPWGKVGRTLGGLAGKAIAGPLGEIVGGKLGSYAHYIGKIFGSGDYVTAANSVKGNVLVNEGQIPQFVSSKDALRIKHREYIGDIISSSTAGQFQVQQFAINPGVAGTFQWLSQVCGSTFQQYRINGMVFEFRSMSADALNSTNTALGSVVMATDYDSADAAFTTKSQMENTEFGVSCKPSSCMLHAIECAKGQTSVSELYIRANAVPSGKDIRFYDMGQFYIATVGCQGTSVNLGELWVSYDITIFKAIVQPPGFLTPSAHYQLTASTLATLPFAPIAGVGNDTIGLTVPSTGLTVVFPLSIPLNSIWMFNYTALSTSGAAGIANPPTFAFSNGLAQFKLLQTTSTNGVPIPNPSTSGAATQRMVGQILFFQYTGGATPNALPTITATASSVPFAAYASGDLVITMLNGQIS